ncbi:MAG: transcriptional repressor LexA [Patescibacteria group bacterium]|nr:transcriptional repressor LexA [Patescibacteria group bacterium]
MRVLTNEITKRQKEVLLAIYSSLKTAGFPPSLNDLKEKLNVSSNQTVLDLLNALEKKKLIRREGGSARGIVILPLGYEAIGKEPLVRLAGITAAGPAIQAIEQDQWIEYSNGYKKYDHDVFVVKVSGNSMIEAGIYDGDLVLIKKEKEYKSGDIVLARIDDDVTLKRFIYDKGRTYLKPENPMCRIIAITHDTFFLGKMMTNLGK